MAGEEKAWRPLRLWRWNAEPATSLDDIPRWIGWLGYAAGLTILGGPAFCYLAYQLGQRDGVAIRSTDEPYPPVRWRLVSWPLPQFLAEKRTVAGLAAIGILLACIGAFLPWATLTESSVGEVTQTGIEVDGLLTLALALAAVGFLAWSYWGAGHGVGRTTLLLACGLTISGIAIYDIIDTNNLAAELRATALVDLGAGIFVTLGGGVAIAVAGVLGVLSRQQMASEPDDPKEFLTLLGPWALLATVLYMAPMLAFGGLKMPLLLLALAAPLVACLAVAHVANLSYRQGLRIGAKTRTAPDELVSSDVWTWALTGAFFLTTFLVYYLTYTGQAVHNHPVRLADAFLEGSLGVPNGKDLLGFLDFAIYNDKYYPLEPPGTALVILLGVAIFGLSINQTFVSLVVGAITAGIVWRLSRGIMASMPQQVALTILFAFGTVYWWNSTYYGVWYFNHAVAVLFLCAAVYETLVSKRPLTAGLLLGAAYITRAPTIWAFPFFLIMFSDQWLAWVKDRPLWKRINLKPLLLFGAGAGVFVVGFAVLNLIRFDTPSPQASYDHWHAYEQLSQPGGMLEHGLVSTEHIQRHRSIFFEKPLYMTDEKPYIYPSWNGAAFWATTPAFLYAFLAAIRKRWLRWAGAALMGLSILFLVIVPRLGAGSTRPAWLDREPQGGLASAIDGVLDFLQWNSWARWQTQWPTDEVVFGLPVLSWLILLPFALLIVVSSYFAFRNGNRLVLACWAAVIPVVAVHFLAASTGWPQFGYRYILDYVPFVFLLTWQGMGDRLRWHHVALIAISVLISFCGVLWVNKFEPDLVGGIHWANW
jgi:hypothetical protein